jgi:hypothetical protein
MEYFSRHPNATLKKMLLTIVLNRFNEHDIIIERDVLRKQQSADSTIQEQFKRIMN